MVFRGEIKAHIDFLERTEQQMQGRLKELPKGRLVIKNAKGNYYYYEEKHGRLKSLISSPVLRNAYLERRDLEKELGKVKRNLASIKKFQKEYEPVITGSLVWQNMKAQQNNYFAENMKHQFKGVNYRSKSELAIAMMLTSYGLEFRYEVLLETEGRMVYPDFAVRRKEDGKVFLWEHFGLVVNKEYRDTMAEKLQAYYDAGYSLWDNLIVSFDREDGRLSGDYIDRIIRIYFFEGR